MYYFTVKKWVQCKNHFHDERHFALRIGLKSIPSNLLIFIDVHLKFTNISSIFSLKSEDILKMEALPAYCSLEGAKNSDTIIHLVFNSHCNHFVLKTYALPSVLAK